LKVVVNTVWTIVQTVIKSTRIRDSVVSSVYFDVPASYYRCISIVTTMGYFAPAVAVAHWTTHINSTLRQTCRRLTPHAGNSRVYA